jgi:hypothetical protein
MTAVYLATAFIEKDTLAKPWMARLRAAGHTITEDWTAGPEVPRGELALPVERQKEIAGADLDGVWRAEIIWLLAPAMGGVGCWVELGWALGFNDSAEENGRSEKRIVVSGPARSIFTSLCERYETHEEAFAAICKGAA